MRIKSIFALLSIVALFVVSSCNKEDEQLQKQDTKTSTIKSARLNTEMTNEEMEAHITAFMDKLADPTNFGDMNYKEAFEDVEATLNYKYVNYDYSKCANTQKFTADIQIAVDANGNMSMESIAAAYNQILADWRTKYHSISETEKTPIVFDITDVTENTVKYTMMVGYGYLDLTKWDKSFVPATSTYFCDAAYEYNNRLYHHLNNTMIQWCPPGNRVYIPQVGLMQYISHTGLPSGAADPIPPGNNNYCDFKLFYSHASLPSHHLNLNSTEYSFYYDQGCLLMTNYLNNTPNANYISQAYFFPVKEGNIPNYYKVMHQFSFFYGYRYFTLANTYTL